MIGLRDWLSRETERLEQIGVPASSARTQALLAFITGDSDLGQHGRARQTTSFVRSSASAPDAQIRFDHTIKRARGH